MPQQGSIVPRSTNQYYNSFAQSNAHTHSLIPEHSLHQIPLPNTGLTPHTAGDCRPGSDSQKNIISFPFFFLAGFFGILSLRVAVKSVPGAGGETDGKGFFLAETGAFVRVHPHETHANENHIIFIGPLCGSLQGFARNERKQQRGADSLTGLTMSRSLAPDDSQHQDMLKPWQSVEK